MSGALPPTLSSLLSLGFQRRPDSYGMLTVGYRFPVLDLTASDSVSFDLSPAVLLSGVLHTSRTIAEIHSEIPPDLETPEQAAAWVSYALWPHRSELEPLPDWLLLGEQYWDLIPSVRRQREYERRPRCLVERDHARILRRSLQAALSQLDSTDTMSFLPVLLGERPGHQLGRLRCACVAQAIAPRCTASRPRARRAGSLAHPVRR